MSSSKCLFGLGSGFDTIASKDFFNSLWANGVAAFPGLPEEVGNILGYIAVDKFLLYLYYYRVQEFLRIV